jgi:flagellar motor switch protein FliN/FliY
MTEKENAHARGSEVMLQELAPVFDIPLLISVEVGRLRLRVRELVKLSPGSVIELKKPAAEPFDICINGAQVARGEVITVEQSSGVRIMEFQRRGGLTS